MPERRGVVTGADRCARVAGALAEAGIVTLRWTSRGRSEVLRARQTDLPALLRDAGPGAAVADPGGVVRLVIRADRIEWTLTEVDEARAAILASLLRE